MSRRNGESFVFDFAEGSDTPIGESHEETLARLATLTAERDKLKAMVVWAVKHGVAGLVVANADDETLDYELSWYEDGGNRIEEITCDCTPASILAAVERASGLGSSQPPVELDDRGEGAQ